MNKEEITPDKFAVLDSLQTFICILDSDGNIKFVNEAWNQARPASGCIFGHKVINKNYFDICEEEVKKGNDHALKVILGIKKIIKGEKKNIRITFSPVIEAEKKWFSVHISSLDDDSGWVIITYEDVSTAFRNSNALYEAEHLYRQHFNQSINGIIIGTIDGRTIDANPAACKILGYTREELMRGGREMILDLNHPKNRKAWEVRRENSVFTGEKVYLHKSGREVPVEVSSVLYRGENGEILTINNFKDLTEKVEAQNQIEKERNFRKAAEASIPGTFYVFNRDGNMIDWNNSFRDDLGYNLDEIEGMNALDFIAEDDKKAVIATINEVFETGESEVVAEIITKKPGRIFQKLRGRKFTSEEGEFLVGTGVDITDQIYAEAERNRTLEIISQLFENSPIGIVQVSHEDEVLKCNSSFKKMFGYKDDDIEESKLDSLITPTDKLEESMINSDKAFQGISWQMESVRKRKDGSEIPVMISSVPIEVDGVVSAIYGMYVDLSEQKELESRIKDLLEREKTTRKNVEQSLAEKSILLQEVHHRVKNNMAVVTGLLELQIMDDDNPEVIQKLREVQGRIYAIAKIHETLYSDEDVVNIRFDKYLHTLIDTIPAFQNIDDINKVVRFNTDPFTLNLNQAVPTGLIINEILSSSIDEKKTDYHPEIYINAKVIDEKVNISIEGEFLNTDILKNESGSDHFRYKLMEILTAQLEANLEINKNGKSRMSIIYQKADIKGSSSSILKTEEIYNG